MPRLARPVTGGGGRKKRSAGPVRVPFGRWPFAAISLPSENPLKELSAGLSEIPWLSGLAEGDAEGHPNKKRLKTVSEFFQYTEQQGENCNECTGTFAVD